MPTHGTCHHLHEQCLCSCVGYSINIKDQTDANALYLNTSAEGQVTLNMAASALAIVVPTLKSARFSAENSKTKLILTLSHPAYLHPNSNCSHYISVVGKTNFTDVFGEGYSCSLSDSKTELVYTLEQPYSLQNGRYSRLLFACGKMYKLMFHVLNGTGIAGDQVNLLPARPNARNESLGLASNSVAQQVYFLPAGTTSLSTAGTPVAIERPKLTSVSYGVDTNTSRATITMIFSAPVKRPVNGTCPDMLVVSTGNASAALGTGATCEFSSNGLSLSYTLGAVNNFKNGKSMVYPKLC